MVHDVTAQRLDDVIAADVQEVVSRVFRYKFGRLSNRRILTVLRTCAKPEELSPLSDADLLARWFEAFDAEYAARRSAKASL